MVDNKNRKGNHQKCGRRGVNTLSQHYLEASEEGGQSKEKEMAKREMKTQKRGN